MGEGDRPEHRPQGKPGRSGAPPRGRRRAVAARSRGRCIPGQPRHATAGRGRRAAHRRVNARAGLRLRSGPGLEHEVLRLLPFGTAVFVEREINGWAAVDLETDGAIDGFLSQAFLTSAAA
ncbi:SH3 domain-containing protein [Immundisolibacter sp.]